MKTLDAAAGKWFGILRHFGIDESFLRNRHGPCPLCGGRDRYRWDDKDGTGSYLCSHCGAGSGIKLLMEVKGWDFKTAAREIDKVVGNIQEQQVQQKGDPSKRIKMVSEKIQNCSAAIRTYLAGRNLKPCKGIKSAKLDYYEEGRRIGEFDCMVCPIVNVQGELLSYHVTYTKDGAKASVSSPKKILPPLQPLAGGAIRLTDVYECIGIAEGIETALAVMDIHKVPCWAACNAHMMETFQVPAGVSHVLVFADHDSNFAGQKAAYTLANRLAVAGYTVGVFVPDMVGDYADVINPRGVVPVEVAA